MTSSPHRCQLPGSMLARSLTVRSNTLTSSTRPLAVCKKLENLSLIRDQAP